MLKQGNDYTLEREKALADGKSEDTYDLRLIYATHNNSYIPTEKFANNSSLLNGSTELYFKPGTVRFGQSGDVDLSWGSAPSIGLDMEFRHTGVSVYFRLLLQSVSAGVEINYINFANGSRDPDENTQRLIAALADARLGAPVAATG
jgi:hypothetical protein